MGKIGDGKDQQFKKDLTELESEIKTRCDCLQVTKVNQKVGDA